MRPRTVLLAVGAAVAVGIVAWIVADAFFLPEEGRVVQDAMPDDAGPALLQGTFRDGAPGHRVAGTVVVHEGADGPFLRFEDYEATDGPAVYLYLVRGDPRTVDRDDVRVLVPGGTEGRATLRGTFNVPLPAAVDPATFNGIVVWCDRFDVEFGSAVFDAISDVD